MLPRRSLGRSLDEEDKDKQEKKDEAEVEKEGAGRVGVVNGQTSQAKPSGLVKSLSRSKMSSDRLSRTAGEIFLEI
jgi:ribosome-interacting GTPase 1